jgi:ferric-chelate reductase
MRVRVLSLSGRAFESHPLTILSSPAEGRGLVLGIRADAGDWSRQLFGYAMTGSIGDEKTVIGRRQAHVLLEGPYGGVSVPAEKDVLLVAGGSGITYALGVLSEIIHSASTSATQLPTAGEDTRRKVQLIWCIRGFGHIQWVAPELQRLASLAASPSRSLDLRIRIFVTCLCDPEAVPPIANCVVEEEIGARPKGGVSALLEEFGKSGRQTVLYASGPESLTREANNAAAASSKAVEMHTELYSM